MTRTIVIGGGVAGLATAALLAHEGHQVRLLERGPRVGGRVGTIERDGFRFDTGPSWYLMPRVFEHFFELLGTTATEQLDLRTLDPGFQVFGEQAAGTPATRLYLPRGAEAVAREFERREPGSAEAVAKYLASAHHTAGLAERFFLYNPFTRLRSLADKDVLRSAGKLCTFLGTSLERFIAQRFNDPLLRQVLGYPAVFLGTDPSRAPAMYHLMSALDLGEGVQYPLGGFWGLVDKLNALALGAGVDIVTDAEVTDIVTEPIPHRARTRRRWATRGVRWRGADGAEHTDPADYVVSAADLHHTETALLPPEARSYPPSWWRCRISGPGAVIALLGVRGALPELEHHSLFFTRDWHANFQAIFGRSPTIPAPASLYVCKPSATDSAVAPEGSENLFVLIPVPADPRIGAGGLDGGGNPSVERTVDRAIDQIADWANIPDLRTRIQVRQTIGPADFARDYHSWRGGMLGPAHTLRQSAFLRAQNQSSRVDGLYYAGATTAPGVGVPMCLISAELVLKRIRGDHSAGATTPQPAANQTIRGL